MAPDFKSNLFSPPFLDRPRDERIAHDKAEPAPPGDKVGFRKKNEAAEEKECQSHKFLKALPM
jgi:hypothetical protein